MKKEVIESMAADMEKIVIKFFPTTLHEKNPTFKFLYNVWNEVCINRKTPFLKSRVLPFKNNFSIWPDEAKNKKEVLDIYLKEAWREIIKKHKN